MQVTDLIKQFRDAAIEKGGGVGGMKDEHLYRLMSDAFHQLVKKGDRGNLSFEKLLNDESPYVRCWAAAQLLFLGFSDAKPVLEELSQSGGPIGLSARVTLEEHKNGRLKSPL
jgi:hypothetical protein